MGLKLGKYAVAVLFSAAALLIPGDLVVGPGDSGDVYKNEVRKYSVNDSAQTRAINSGSKEPEPKSETRTIVIPDPRFAPKKGD